MCSIWTTARTRPKWRTPTSAIPISGWSTGRARARAFHLQGTITPGHNLKIICGILPVDKVAAVAKQYRISITELLVGVYLYELYIIQQQGGFNTLAPVRVSVPINVRRYYPTRTLRNFALYANPGIEPAYGVYTLEEIFGLVHHFMRYTINEKYLNALMSANVGPEKNMLHAPVAAAAEEHGHAPGLQICRRQPVHQHAVQPGRCRPAARKWPSMSSASNSCSDRPTINPVNCAVVSTGNQMVITFSGTMEETDPQRAFFKQLVRLGIPVRIESNTVYEE